MPVWRREEIILAKKIWRIGTLSQERTANLTWQLLVTNFLSWIHWAVLELTFSQIPSTSESKSSLSILQNRRYYTWAVNYRTYRFANYSARYDETVSRCIRIIVVKVTRRKWKRISIIPVAQSLSLTSSQHLNWHETLSAFIKTPVCWFLSFS